MVFGTWRYAAGTSGTVTLPEGATVKQIIVHASGAATMTIFGGASIPIIAGVAIAFRFAHDLCVAGQVPGAALTIVFTGTDSFFIETIGPGSTAT
jgi:hypothetical protein